jgi:hypothetical protein
MRLLDHVTPNFSADGCVICGYEKSHLIWQSILTYFINYSRTLIHLLGLFSKRNFKVFMQKNKAWVVLCFILAPQMHSLYITDVPTTPDTHNALFPDDTIWYNMERHKHLFSSSYRLGTLKWRHGAIAGT